MAHSFQPFEVRKEDDGYFAIEAEPRLRHIGAVRPTPEEAVAALLEYHAELVRSGAIRLEELVK